MSENSTISEPPIDPELGDHVHLITRALIASTPYIGGAAVELFNALVRPPLETRQQKWLEEVAQAIKNLQNKVGISIEELQTNDRFIDTILYSTQIALRNSQEEKRAALVNAIFNAGLPNSPEESQIQMFLNFIDTFTVWHLKILKLFHEPGNYKELHGFGHRNELQGGLWIFIEEVFPEMRSNQAFCGQVWKNLYDYGLVEIESLYEPIIAGNKGVLSSRTTRLGKKFIKFVLEDQ